MNTDKEEPLFKAQSQQVVGSAMEVLNEIGHGFHEKPYEKIVLNTKVIEKITDREIGQMMNYLKVTGLRLGYILNFKQPKLEWKRVVQ